MHTVLGIDIYGYSQFKPHIQPFIPFLFEEIYNHTLHLLFQNFHYIFQTSSKEIFQSSFISTGDGGYQIFDTPLHAVIFALTFEAILRFYNSSHMYIRLGKMAGELSLRYAFTLDNLYNYKDDYYGPAIINNSRLLSSDKLNRALLDENTYQWFLRSIMGIENLQTIGLKNISKIPEFKDYSWDKAEKGHNALIFINNDVFHLEGIKAVDIQKIGIVRVKQTELVAHNLHIQALLEYTDIFNQDMRFTVSLGNLNMTGIT
jgi:hypothetical protein